MSAIEQAGQPGADIALARKVKGSGTSFYAAMCLLPRARRNAMFAIYAFCREVDDIADEAGPLTEKRKGLDFWRAEIARLYDGGAVTHPTALALQPHVAAFGLKRQDFLDLIDGMQMDAETDIVAPSWAELDLYCDRVASAVGRLSVRAFGAVEAAAIDVAHHLGRALQLTNILRDLGEDARRNRLYLPREALAAHGIAGDDPASILGHRNLALAAREVAEKAMRHFQEAHEAMDRCDRRAMRPARLMGAVYREILNEMMLAGWRDPEARVSLSRVRKLWLLVRHGLI